MSTLPCSFTTTCSTVFNNEIHIFAGTSHYKWDGSSWTSVSTLPFSVVFGATAAVYNYEIHLIGTGNTRYHYKWDGSTWIQASTLPVSVTYGFAVSHKNEIHLLNNITTESPVNVVYDRVTETDVSGYYYKWDGSSWTQITSLPIFHTYSNSTDYYYRCYYNGVFVYDDFYISSRLLAFANSSSKEWRSLTYKLVDNKFVYLSKTIPGACMSNLIEINGEIHSTGSYMYIDRVNYNYHYHYKYNIETGESNKVIDELLPYNVDIKTAVIKYDNKMHVLGGTNAATNHYCIHDSVYYKTLK